MSVPYLTPYGSPIKTDENGNQYLDTTKTETIYANNTNELSAMLANGEVNSVSNQQEITASADESKVDDKDDGKVGFFKGLFSVVKGAVKGIVGGIKGMFTDENGKFSLWKTLKSAGTIAACFIPGVGPFIGAGLCAYGVVKGGTGVIKSIGAAANAKTDAEKIAALESLGANGITTVASAYGLKGSVGAIAKNMGGASGATFGQNLSTIKAGIKAGKGVTGKINNLTGGIYKNSWSTATAGKTGAIKYVSGAKAVAKQMVKDGGKNIISTGHHIAQRGRQGWADFKGRLKTKQPLIKKGTQRTNWTQRGKDYINSKTEPMKAYAQEKITNAKNNFKAKHTNAANKYSAAKTGFKAYKRQVGKYINAGKNATVYGVAPNKVIFTTAAVKPMTEASDQMLNQVQFSNLNYVQADVTTGQITQLPNYVIYQP